VGAAWAEGPERVDDESGSASLESLPAALGVDQLAGGQAVEALDAASEGGEDVLLGALDRDAEGGNAAAVGDHAQDGRAGQAADEDAALARSGLAHDGLPAATG
jgi:hypothetical protein